MIEKDKGKPYLFSLKKTFSAYIQSITNKKGGNRMAVQVSKLKSDLVMRVITGQDVFDVAKDIFAFGPDALTAKDSAAIVETTETELFDNEL